MPQRVQRGGLMGDNDLGLRYWQSQRLTRRRLLGGAAAVVVVGIGTCAYFLRRLLGLTAPPPVQPSGGHH